MKVYEKIKPGIWIYNGIFRLVDAWQKEQGKRKVWKFRLEMATTANAETAPIQNLVQGDVLKNEPSRMIPADVKLEVWRRDHGVCRICGATTNLHFDHILPFSKGGASQTAKNIQPLRQNCNLTKSAKIE